jgi:endo-1,4-beta-xylanase
VVQKGNSITLSATVLPTNATKKTVTWTSSNKNVATVNASGKVTAKGNGTATITATATDGSGKKASCTIIAPYSITYMLDKGTNSTKNPATYYNEKVTLKNPTRAGYQFQGWYTDSKYKTKITTIKKGTKKNYTLYAKWQKVTVSSTTITSGKNNKTKQIQLKFKKVSGAKGYEISYSTNKNFKKSVKKTQTAKTSATIKKLKKGTTYYVRIQAYKLDSAGKKVYSKYSKVCRVKITK